MSDYLSSPWRGGLLKEGASPRITPKSEFLSNLENAQKSAADLQKDEETRATEARQAQNRRLLGLTKIKDPDNLLRLKRK